ncbi:hydrogenase expression protein [candidate division MSBL1 archaeon SCGC-AAA382A20]|uniref:Hydrogenase expression protein n=1 Tax=candidate division MSBL1 archaeon SCGC-AAA382A20 TaxID=1698280 RepID=A0A133VJ87_9EURY|nr:hydrogenase expression protein [candidate division MSBL1 archaeon SCGC-AAA382A20]
MGVVQKLDEKITLEEGAGGEEMINLLKKSILPFIEGRGGNVDLGVRELDDGAAIRLNEREYLVVTTDSHVVKPRFFPGGDLGKLAVAGTINDLAVMGANPKALSSGVVIEEGFDKDELEKISESMGQTAEEAKVPIVTGDLKVLGRGETDGILINTSGFGISSKLTPTSGLKPGNKIIVSGTMGDHGMTIVTNRENFESSIKSDIAPVHNLVRGVLEVDGVTAMKDPTRGGLAAALNEMASGSEVGIKIKREKIPVTPEVRGAGEMLGIDPLMIANEGKVVIGVEEFQAEQVLEALRDHELGKDSEIIGECTQNNVGKVILETEIGSLRILKPPRRKPIPRIC